MTTLDIIKKLAKDRGWSLQTVAEKAGLGINTIYRWNTKTPSTESLQKVASVFQVTVAYLLGTGEAAGTTKKVVDIDDDTILLAFDGKPIPEEDKELFKRLLRGK